MNKTKKTIFAISITLIIIAILFMWIVGFIGEANTQFKKYKPVICENKTIIIPTGTPMYFYWDEESYLEDGSKMRMNFNQLGNITVLYEIEVCE